MLCKCHLKNKKNRYLLFLIGRTATSGGVSESLRVFTPENDQINPLVVLLVKAIGAIDCLKVTIWEMLIKKKCGDAVEIKS